MEMLDDAGVPVGTNRYIKTSTQHPKLTLMRTCTLLFTKCANPANCFCIHNNSFLTTGLP